MNRTVDNVNCSSGRLDGNLENLLIGSNSDHEMSEDMESDISLNDSDLDYMNESLEKGGASKLTKRIRRKNYCCYCKSLVTCFARHLGRAHSSELEVQKFLSEPIKSKERKNIISMIRKKGNYIKTTKTKNIRPVMKTSLPESIDTHLPCEYCLGFYSRKQLWRHRKKCPQNTTNGKGSSLASSQNLLCMELKTDEELRAQIFPHMRADNISLVAKRDFLICEFGAKYLKTHREKKFVNITSRKMRELSRLLIELKKNEPLIKNLFDCLKPCHYDLLVQSTISVAQYNKENNRFCSPFFAMYIWKSLKDCCNIAFNLVVQKKYSCTTRVTTAEAELNLKTLIHLFKSNWYHDVSSQAIGVLNGEKWCKVTIMQLASDLKTFDNYLAKNISKAATELLSDKFNVVSFVNLLELLFCRVFLLNNRTPVEIKKIFLSTYLSSGMQNNYEEFKDTITPIERVLMSKFKVVKIKDEQNFYVPVMFSNKIQEHLSILLEARPNFFDKSSNPYLFGRTHSKLPVNDHQILEKHAKQSGIKNPKVFMVTHLKKYTSTLTQIFNMNECDIDQLTTFIGHTDWVKQAKWRVSDDLFKISKVCKLLIMMEKESSAQWIGKSLDEIEIDMDEDLLQAVDKVSKQTEKDYSPNVLANDDGKKIMSSSKISLFHVKNHNRRILVPWTNQQKMLAKKFFKNHIESKKAPRKKECENFVNLHHHIFGYKPWQKIKVFIQNLYKKNR